jgi:hypothetical protein
VVMSSSMGSGGIEHSHLYRPVRAAKLIGRVTE